MGEQLGGSHENEAMRTEKDLIALLNLAKMQAATLAARRFSTKEEVTASSTMFAEGVDKMANSLDGARGVKIRASGAGVKVSNSRVDYNGEGKVTVSIDTQEPYVAPDFLSTTEGYYVAAPVLFDQDDDGYFAIPHVLLENTQETGARFVSEEDLPIGVLRMSRFILASLSGTKFEIPTLEAYKTRNTALSELALDDAGEGGGILEALQGLVAAFNQVNDDNFLPLHRVDYLHRIARAADIEVDVEVVITAVRGIFGSNRLVEVQALAFEGLDDCELKEVEITGKVLEILSSHDELQLDEPTLVVACSSPDDTERLYYVPFGCIEKLRF